jgi:hypothetical protein
MMKIMGAIIRDSHGAMVAATSTYISHLVDAPMAEAYALKEGLMLVQHIGGNRLVVQSDCMEVVEIMMNDGFTVNSAAAVMMNVKLFREASRRLLLSIQVGKQIKWRMN